MAYIEAVIECDCEAIAARTEWMQARQKRLETSGSTPAELQADRELFCDTLCTRDPEGFHIAAEGVDDPYLFFPGVKYTFVGKDAGRDDLGVPVASRTWVTLRFPSPTRCLHDLDGKAISGITVGLNVSADGQVVKAGVLGNAEIQWDSIRYSW